MKNRKIQILVAKAMIVAMFLAAFSACEQVKADQQKDRPNVIIFLADDLGYGDLGSYGHPVIQSPNLDQLAQNGLKLTRCYAASPVCSPSRAGLITGRNPNRLGIYDWIPENSVMHIADSILTIPAMLQANGYKTAMFGKWHCNGKFNTAEQPQPGDLGFDHWIATQNNAIPSHKDPINFVKNGKPMGEMKGYSSQLMASEVINWLDAQAGDEPFFAYVPFHEPHEPIASPEDLVKSYSDKAINENQATYFANVTNMDKAIGSVLDKLRSQGKLDNTLVIFTSDNGPETLGRYHGTEYSYGSSGSLRGMKVQLYEGGIRVPCIISWPSVIKQGRTSDEVVSSLDFLPTLASIVGEQLDWDGYDGESVLSLISGEPYKRKKDLFWFYPTSTVGPNVALISGDKKLMAQTAYQYLEPGNTKGILIGQETMDAVKGDSISDDFLLYDLMIYQAEQQTLTTTESLVLNKLKEKLAKYFYTLRADSPYLKFEN